MSNDLVKGKTVLPMRISPRGERLRAVADEVREFLVFSVGDDLMGLPLASVREILKLVPVTEVPRAPADVLGILSVRGRITTVFDLRKRLRMPAASPTRHARILLIEAKDEIMGARVDAVHHVERLREDEIEPAGVVGGELPDHIIGLGRPRRARGEADDSATTVIVLLDPATLLSRPSGQLARQSQERPGRAIE
jgi:purine-binding chemotaxis protein CheW